MTLADQIPLMRDDTLPKTLIAFTARFCDETACADVLRRWKYGGRGFVCRHCGGKRAWYLPSRRLDECRTCHRQMSLSARKKLTTTETELSQVIYEQTGGNQDFALIRSEGDLALFGKSTQAIQAEIDADAWATLHSDTSRPFEKPASGRVAVKVVNHLGDEVIRVFRAG